MSWPISPWIFPVLDALHNLNWFTISFWMWWKFSTIISSKVFSHPFPLPFLEEKDSWTPGPTDQRLLLGFCILRPSLLNFRVFPNSMNSCSSLERCPRWCALLFQGGTEKNFPLHNVPLSSFFCCVWTGVPQRHGCVNILRGVYLTCESLSHFGGACYNSIYKSSL